MIQISHLTVQSFDPYDGTYNYLVEVFDKSPEDQDANLLATGFAQRKRFSIRKLSIQRRVGSSLHTIDDPYRISSYRSSHLNTGNDNVCAFDSLAVSQETTATPVSRTPTRSVSSTYTFIIEDSFPNYGDYDFNDAVIKVQMKTSMKDDYVQFANIKLTFRALGGTKRPELSSISPA